MSKKFSSGEERGEELSLLIYFNIKISGSSAAFRRIYEEPIVKARQPGASSTEISLGEERGAELSRMTQMFVLRRTQEINNKYLPPKCKSICCTSFPLIHFFYI